MKLSKDEFDTLTSLAERSGCDCWFSIKEKDEKKDVIYDLEENKEISLLHGINDLLDGCEHIITPEEYDLVTNLISQLKTGE